MSAGVALISLGIGVAACPPTNSSRRRLHWLACTRLGNAPVVDHPADQIWAAAAVVDALVSRLRRRTSTASLLAVVATVTGLTVARTLGPIPGLLACSGLLVGGRLWLRSRAEQSGEAARGELATAVTALADEFTAGSDSAKAFRSASAAAGRFRPAFEAAGLAAQAGDGPGQAWAVVPELADLAVALSVAQRAGAPVVGVLTGLRDTLRADRASAREVRTALAGPRSSAMLLAGLPILGLGLGAAMGANPGGVLLHTGWGLAALSSGVILDLLGLIWTAALVARAGP